MLVKQTTADLAEAVGTQIGISDWLEIDQAMIDRFADATGDRQWIHVDTERARKELPGGRTIAHGYLTLALVPRLLNGLYRVERKSRAINYGLNRVRFPAPLAEGSRIRLRSELRNAEPVQGGFRFTFLNTFEVEGRDKPAAVVEAIIAIYD